MNESFKIGADQAIITLQLGTLQYGYAFKRPAATVNDDLRANAIVIEQGEKRAALISADIVSIGKELGNRLRKQIEEETNIPFENISISATHTHSGPAIKTAKGWGNADESYINDILIPQTIAAVKGAAASVVPAIMGVGTTRSEVGINRRELTQEGKIILGQNEYGIFDPKMTVISFKTLDGAPITNIIHYGAHGTAAGRGLEITRDWPGVMVDMMEKETGAHTIFFNGAEGDVGPRLSNGQTTGDVRDWTKTEDATGDISYVYEIGTIAGFDAIRAYKSIKEYCSVEFNVESGFLTLPYDPQWRLEDAKARLAELDAKESLIEVENREYAKHKAVIEMYENNIPFDTHLEMKQTIFSFNSIAIVPFQLELFSEIALRMRKYSPFEHTLCLCNTNDSNFYLPSRDQMARGGYEVDIYRLANVYKFVDNLDDVIINENMRILKKMKPFEIQKKVRYV